MKAIVCNVFPRPCSSALRTPGKPAHQGFAPVGGNHEAGAQAPAVLQRQRSGVGVLAEMDHRGRRKRNEVFGVLLQGARQGAAQRAVLGHETQRFMA